MYNILQCTTCSFHNTTVGSELKQDAPKIKYKPPFFFSLGDKRNDWLDYDG